MDLKNNTDGITMVEIIVAFVILMMSVAMLTNVISLSYKIASKAEANRKNIEAFVEDYTYQQHGRASDVVNIRTLDPAAYTLTLKKDESTEIVLHTPEKRRIEAFEASDKSGNGISIFSFKANYIH